MAKSHTITFSITGNENLSAAIKSAQNALKGLSSKSIAAMKSLDNNRALLNQIGAYRKLQQSIRAAQNARADEMLSQSRLMAQRKQATQQLSDMKKTYAGLNDYYKANKKNLGTEAAQVFKEQLKGARAEIQAQQKLIRGIDKSYDTSSARANQLRSQIATQQAQLTQARLTLPPGTLAGQEAALRAQIQATTNALNAEINALERRNQIQANFSQRQQDLANAYSNFQNAMDTAQTIMNPFKDAADNAITFEAAMKKVEGLTQMPFHRKGDLATVRKNMKMLSAQAKELGATTEYFSTDIAEAMSYYGYAGWDTQQILSVMPSTVDMATVTKVPLARLADMFSDDLTILGIRAGEKMKLDNGRIVDAVEHTADAWTYAVTNANLDAEALHTALTYNAGGLRLAGLSSGDIFGFNMILANAGIKGSKAGTALNTGVIRLMAPAKKGAKALEELGFTASEAEKEMALTQETMAAMGLTMDASVTDKILVMKRAWDENKLAGEESANAAMLNALVGKDAFKGWAELLDSDKLEQALEIARKIDSGEIEGYTKDTAEVMRDTTDTQIKYLQSALDALQLNTGESLAPTIRAAAEALTPLVQSVADFVAQHPAMIQACAGIAAAISTIIVAAAGFSLVMAGFRFFISGLETAGLLFGGLGGKIGAVLRLIMAFPVKHPGITALAAAGLLIYENWEKVSGAIEKVLNALSGIKDKFSGFMAGVNEFIPKWQAGDFSGAIDSFKTAYTNATIPTPSSWGEYRRNEQELDASALQSSVDNVTLAMESIQNPAYELSNSLMMTSPATQALADSATNAASSTDMLSASSTGAATSTDALSASAIGSTGNINSMSASAAASTGNISSMASSAASAAGSISGLGGAAQSAIGALLSAGASAAGAIHGAIGAAIVAAAAPRHNATGGIYPRGEFLTTFAENSPEAAIPIDNSARSLSLWQETGRMLGVGGGDNISLNMTINIAGNADRDDIRDGVYEALPSIERMLSDYTHERRRRAYV